MNRDPYRLSKGDELLMRAFAGTALVIFAALIILAVFGFAKWALDWRDAPLEFWFMAVLAAGSGLTHLALAGYRHRPEWYPAALVERVRVADREPRITLIGQVASTLSMGYLGLAIWTGSSRFMMLCLMLALGGLVFDFCWTIVRPVRRP